MTEALVAAGEPAPSRPCRLRVRRLALRWRKAIPLEATLLASHAPAAGGHCAVCVRDQLGDIICDAEVWVDQRVEAPLAATVAPGERETGEETADALRAAVRRYAAANDEALRVYRSLRGWRLMLFVQKGYSLLRTGFRPWCGWLWRALRGCAELDTHELQLPYIDDYVK
ncbi:MAG: hypothetical protein KA072_10385 [Thermoanaerobaculaceae bacterium]|nr:hypothetical protein [Thermoanaerobaculaceae bacterium]MDI9621079.1 hypothetical protein [Acidobacteriota bacterium]NLH09899.1 hypothetical protein [Holophagae bacterium]HPW55514.1 hypothetical protein [Thermoanaerobaculaceae bacterium]